jgi:hypothetical protein
MRPHRVPPAVKIALGYLVFAVAWVLVSDRVLDALVSDAGLEDCWQTVKGTVFVVASAVFVYFLTRRYLDRAEASTRRLAEAYDETLAGWAAALDIRDHSTGEHTARVTALAVDLGRRLGLSDDEIEQLRRGAILHDIGKMALPDRGALQARSARRGGVGAHAPASRPRRPDAHGRVVPRAGDGGARRAPRALGRGTRAASSGRRSRSTRGCSRWSTSTTR